MNDVMTAVMAAVRRFTGTDALPRMETTMASAVNQLMELRTMLTDYNADVDAKLDQLLAATGELNPEAQAAFDDLKATVAAADAKIGDADGSEKPPPADENLDPTVQDVFNDDAR